MSILILRDVVKSYGALRALDGVTLELGRGEYVGLLGPNGAGKSTLFQVIAGLFAADAGEVRLFGTTHRVDGPSILARLGVVFQMRSIDLDMTIHANLRFHGRLFGLSGRRLEDRIANLGQFFDMTELLGRPVRSLSGGQQRRVEIARALIAEPSLLIMDEPSAGLDATSRAELVAHIRVLARDQGVAVLWATHLVNEVEAADRVVVLTKGRVVADSPPETLLARTGALDLTGAYATLIDDSRGPLLSEVTGLDPGRR